MKRTLLSLVTLLLWVNAFAQKTTVSVNGNDQEFQSFSEAVAAANTASDYPTVKVSEDGTVASLVTVRRSMTIDLNGHTLTSELQKTIEVNAAGVLTLVDTSNGEQGKILVEFFDESLCNAVVVTKGGLVINSGNIVVDNPFHGSYAVVLRSWTSFTMTGGSIINSVSGMSYGISASGSNISINVSGGHIKAETYDMKQSAAINSYGATINITGGVVEAVSNWRAASGIDFRNGSATIDGGKVIAKCYNFGRAVYVGNSAKLTINGGEVIYDNKFNETFDVQLDPYSSSFVVNGGKFAHEGKLQSYCGSRYTVLLSPTDEAYQDGCRFTIADEKTETAIARNLTKNEAYSTLEAALSAAVAGDTVSLVNDYTLAADATVKKGVVLLIPFDALNTCFTKHPKASFPHVEEAVYRTLNVAENVTLTVEGEMSVCALQTSLEGGQSYGAGSVYAMHALVNLAEGSAIKVNGGLYCWGYIAGKGEVVINSGAELYEAYQIVDWHGGNIAYDISDKTYVFNQYAIQNIESKLTLMPGAAEYLGTDLCFSDDNDWYKRMHRMNDLKFIGPKEGLFVTGGTAKITREYDGTTDRVNYTIDGDASLGKLTIYLGDYMFDADQNAFPIPSNFSITLNSGTFTVPTAYYLEAGAQITVSPEANLNIAKGGMLALFDAADWGTYGTFYVYPVEYTIANGHDNRIVRWAGSTGDSSAAKAMITSAGIDVQGKVDVYGKLMTSKGGSDIKSTTGTGKIALCYEKAVADSTIYVCNGNTSKTVSVRFTSPQLTNADGPKTSTASLSGVVYAMTGNNWAVTGTTAINAVAVDDRALGTDGKYVVGNRLVIRKNGRTFTPLGIAR